MKMKQLPLSEVKTGQSCKVIDIATGCGLCKRMEALGVRPGKVIRKVGSVFARGPIVVDVDGFQLAIGHCKACRVLVEVEDS